MLIDILDISIKVSKQIESHSEIILLQFEDFTHFQLQQQSSEIEEIKPTIYQLIDCHIPKVIEQILILIQNALLSAPYNIRLMASLQALPDLLLEKLQMYINQPKYYQIILECLIRIICDWNIQFNKGEVIQKKHNRRQQLERLLHFKQAHLLKFCNLYDSLRRSNFKAARHITFDIHQYIQEPFE